MQIDRSRERAVECAFAWMLLIMLSPMWIPVAVVCSPYLAYKGVKAVSKKCTTIPPDMK